MRHFLRFPFIYLIMTLCFSSCADRKEPGTKWTSLFNGTDLTGWKVECLEEDRGKAFWKVADGAIECDSTGRQDHDYVWLVSEHEYGNFELELQFQAFRDLPGNSGVQFRSRYDSSPDAPHGGWLDGPQVDIHPPAPWRIGLIYDETREEKRWIHPSLPDWKITPEQGQRGIVFKFSDEDNGWNHMRIRCSGMRIQVWLNDAQITDFDGSGLLDDVAHRTHNVGTFGHIAFQLHTGDSLKMRFRDIRIREVH